MRKKKNIVIYFMAGVFLIVAISSCSLAQGKLKGRVSIWGGHYNNKLARYALETGFLKDHPEVKVEYSGYPYSKYAIKMKMAFGAHSADPDIVTIHNHWIKDFYVHGHLLELTDKLGKEGIQNYLAWMWEPVRDSEGRIWGIPNDNSVSGFFYRKDIYEEYGLSVPQTYDGFVTVAKKLKEQGKYAGIYDISNGDASQMLAMVGTCGLDWFNSKGEMILDSPQGKGIYAAKLIKKLIDLGIFFNGSILQPETYTALEEGKIACFHTTTAYPIFIKDHISEKSEGFGKWRFTLPPQMVDDPVADLGTRTITHIAISRWSDNKDLAWEVIKWLRGSIEGGKLIAFESSLMPAYIPALRELATKGSPVWPFFNQEIASEYAKALLTCSVHLPCTHESLWEAYKITDEELAYMLAGEKTPEGAIKTAADRIRRSLGR